jgi:cytoskeletal protein CcmA (bactofilin family)
MAQTDKPPGKIPLNTSRLSSNTVFKGELSGPEDVIIEGKYQGKIHLENSDLTIESAAWVKAEIWVQNIIVRGTVEGNIHATGKVFIEKEAQMIGDIAASRISIMEGAQFKGSVKMLSTIK